MYRHRELLHYGVLPAPSCRVCVEQWNIHNYTNQKLTSEEMMLYKKWISKTQNTRIIVDKDAFKTTCIALGKLRNIAGTREYEHIYKMFRQCLSLCQYAATGNIYVSSKLG
uniref:Uncharacterized protein n=1 Tax=Pectinophora gossypiella TaxID=13191 RepID=A0A1E1W404_PECGO